MRRLFVCLCLCWAACSDVPREDKARSPTEPPMPYIVPTKVGFRLPSRVKLTTEVSNVMEMMDTYQLSATPSGCRGVSFVQIQPYAEAGEMDLDPTCDWDVILALGASPQGDGLRTTYYESATFHLPRSDLRGKSKVDLVFNLRLQAMGKDAGFKSRMLMAE